MLRLDVGAFFRYDFHMTVKVRIAPSPTGHLHVGTARTALFNWLFARHHGGQFILRIEDTDLERSKPEFETGIIDGLRWLGLDWDNTELYRQSERLDIYKKYLVQLIDAGVAIERKYTDEEKDAIRKEGREPRDSIIVLKEGGSPEDEIGFDDSIRGHVAVQQKHVGSISLAKDLDTPLYNFAVVVDDIDMGISHVIRGEDHISNTPKQLLIYRALGKEPPQFAHLPLILGADKSKMSKRHGATSIAEYQKDYLPEAMLNFMGFLGYTYDQEMLTKEEMAAQFDLARVHKSGAVFDVKKLNWFNAQYIRHLTPHAFKALIGQADLPDEAVPVMTERLERLTDIGQFAYLWQTPEYDADLLCWKDESRQDTIRALQAVMALDPLTGQALDALAAEQFEGQKGRVYWPLRVALSGQRHSAGPLDIAAVIGQGRVKERIQTALEKLQEK
jgi:glutamyl/glutaminyl-tRNA synthetase